MTQDVTAGIGIQIDSRSALDQLRQLQAGISQFNQSVVSTNAAAVARQRDLISSFAHQVEATKQFSTGITTVESSVHRLGKSIDTGKLKLGEYFTYGLAASGKFNNAFAKKHSEIMQVATDRVKRLQTQYVALGESSNGMTKALAVRPLNLFNAQAAITTQRMQLFNKLMADGTTSLINWGKNTQWAGRQLMVGFSVPLTIFGAMAAKTFTDIEKAMVSFKRVYGDTMTTDAETNKALENVKALANEYTKYGIAVSDTIGLASKAAALGAEGPDLMAQTEQATRLATLGQIEYQQALDTTISLQTAFGISAKDLGSNIDFLNAVENQTVLSINDITESIPKVAPVIQALGGNVKDLAYMLTAMREGGVNAAEGSNALKSGLMSLINPTQAAIDKAKELGIDLQGLVQANSGDLPGMIKAVGDAFNSIDDGLAKQQLMGKVFGKYQVARMTAMFENISKDGGQASRVLDLMGRSTQNLATLSEKELSKVENAVSTKWAGSLERLKAEIAPIGELFLKMATPIVDAVTGMVKWFNDLNPVVKNVGVVLSGAFLVALPVVTMLVGLFANMFGNILKGIIFFKNLGSGFSAAAKAARFLETSELDTLAASASLEGKVHSLTSGLDVQRVAVEKLTLAYKEMYAAADAALINGSKKGFRISSLPGYAKGRVSIVPGSGSGTKDTELAMLAPGEAVINAKDSKRYAPLLAAINEGKVPGYARGKTKTYATANVGGTEIQYRPAQPASVGKIQRLIDEVLSAGEHYSTMLITMFKKLEGNVVSTNALAMDLMNSGIKRLEDIGSDYYTVSGHNAPESYRQAKLAGLKNNPQMNAYFDNIFDYIAGPTEQWAKSKGLKHKESLKSKANYGTHISHLTKTPSDGGKLWMGKRVAIDSGYINTYLQSAESSMGKLVKTLVAMDRGGAGVSDAERLVAEKFMQIATSTEDADGNVERFALSAEQAKKELALLAQGIHPQTQNAVAALRAVARTDLAFAEKAEYKGRSDFGTSASSAWAAYAADRGTTYSLENNGYQKVSGSKKFFSGLKGVMWDRDQSKYRDMTGPEFAAADKATDSLFARMKRFALKFSKGAANMADVANSAINKAQASMEVHSPSEVFVKLGNGVAEGAAMARESILSSIPKNKEAYSFLAKSIATESIALGGSAKNAGVKVSESFDQAVASLMNAGIAAENAAVRVISGGESLEKALIAQGMDVQKAAELNSLMSAGAGTVSGEGTAKRGFGQRGLFAADAIFMAGSFIPGQIGEFSQNLMFATMGLQALTGVASAIQGTKIAGMFAPLAQNGILASGALGAIVSTGGLAIAGLAALGGVAWLIYNQYQEHEKKLNSFGEAIKTSTDTLTGFANKFGYTETISSINTQTSATDKDAASRAMTAQQAVKEQQESDEKFKAKMDTLRAGTEAEAEQILRQTFMSLIASGAPADVARSIVEQMANEANKQKIFKSIVKDLDAAVGGDGKIKDIAEVIKKNVSSGLEGAVAERERALKQAQEDYDNAAAYSADKNDAADRIAKLNDQQESLKRSVADTIQQTSQDLNRMLNTGLIDQEQFTDGFYQLKYSIMGVFDGDNTKLAAAFNESIKGLTDSVTYAGPLLNDAEVAAATLQAVMSGANADDINKALTEAGTNADIARVKLIKLAQAAIANPVVSPASKVPTLETQIKETKAKIAALKNSNKKSGGSSGGGGSKPSKYDKKSDAIAKANARLDLSEVKIDKTEDAKIQAAMDKRWGGKTIEIDGLSVTVENSADIDYAMQQISERIEDINRDEIDPLNEKLDKLNETQDAINRKTAEYQQEIDKINESYDAQTKPLERANDLLTFQKETIEAQRDKQLEGIDLQTTALQNQIDTAEYAAQVQGQLIDDQIEKNNLNAELIQKQVDAIDDQVSALEDVKKINEILSAQKQSQLSLASALSSGDAGAAASAMLNAQSTAASGASELQSAGLQAQRDELQTQIDAISEQNDLLSKRKDAIDKGVDALNRQLSALNQQRTVIENNYKLEIQGIENSIAANSERLRQLEYERTTRTQFWQDQIDKYAPQLRDLSNEIYAIEQQIKKIQDEKISPLEKQKDLLDDIAGDVKDQISREKAVIDQKRKQLDYSNKINSAMKTLYDKARSAAGATGGIGSALSGANSEMDELTKQLTEYESQLKTAKFQMAVEQGLVVRDSKGRIRQFDSFQGLQAFMSTKEGVGAKYVSVNELQGGGKVDGKEYKSYDSLARAIANKMDNKITKPVVLELYKDPDKDAAKIKTKKIGSDILYSLSGGPWIGKARGGLVPGKGGILPGFRGVAHGDDRAMMMRSGEGVTVSEALRANKYESQRLLALNRAALSGNMGGFYREWSAPELTNTVANVQPVATTSGSTIHNEYNFDITGGPNVNTDELVNKVVYKIKESQRGQIRSM